jgi:hypothetical protein
MTIWVGEVEGEALVFDPSIQLPDCPHLFLWSPTSSTMRKFIAEGIRKRIKPCRNENSLADYIAAYKMWHTNHASSWIEGEKIYYEERKLLDAELERKRIEQEETRRRREEARALYELQEPERVAEEARRRDQLAAEFQRSQIEQKEFDELVAELKPLGFRHSSLVSNYIKRNKLGNKYRHISGILHMERDGESWTYFGGIRPKYFARLCDELGLSNKRSGAVPIAFESFDSIKGDHEER